MTPRLFRLVAAGVTSIASANRRFFAGGSSSLRGARVSVAGFSDESQKHLSLIGASLSPETEMLAQVSEYYTDKVRQYGATPKGVDWNSAESQLLRFSQLTKLIQPNHGFSLLDYGCGYCALYNYLKERFADFRYTGYDISDEMLEAAKETGDVDQVVSDRLSLEAADYVVASGIFNVKLDYTVTDWETYVFSELDLISSLGRRGFAANFLTAYSDPDRMRDDLYYANPGYIFKLCKERYSRNVALLHDYDLYEFTVLVRKQ